MYAGSAHDSDEGIQQSQGSLVDEDGLPQPQNMNQLSQAPLAEKLLTSSSYFAAEIPLKVGHFMNNLWMSSADLMSHDDDNRSLNHELWLLGCRYEMPDDKSLRMQQDILDAQQDDMFRPPSHDPSYATPHQLAASSSSSSRHGNDHHQQQQQAAVMSIMWPPDFYQDFTSRFWMTYRYNYPPIRPSHYKTDIGWGCMLRSGQSLLANALLIHFLSRQWRRTSRKHPSHKTYVKITQWFLDELSPRAPFSIHRIALLGKQLGKNIGEWFGPSTISQVIQALVSDFPPAKLAVYIASDGVVYRKDVLDVATGKKPRGEFGYWTSRADNHEQQEARDIYNESTDASSDACAPSSPPPAPPTAPAAASSSTDDAPPFKACLILVAIRLGIDQLHPSYYPALKACFRIPHFVGIAGGRPNSSLYFMGLQDDDLIYIDPHFSRCALETKAMTAYSDQDLATYHCNIPRKLHISQVDPSMMLGFYCRNAQEFESFCEEITRIGQVHSAIFSIQEQAPEYDEDVRSENDFGIVSDDEPDPATRDSLDSSTGSLQ